MSKKYLGDTFDIHGGGMDNIFPHHECETAQSECANGCKFVNYFIHNNLVTVNGQKMGKSLGNFITLPDLFKKYNPIIIRFYTLLSQYRRPTDFDDSKIIEAEKSYKSICDALDKCRKLGKVVDSINNKEILDIKNKFIEAMDDDFNTSLAISYIYELVKIINKTNEEEILLESLYFIDNVVDPILGLNFMSESKNNNSDSSEYIEYILELRRKFREEKKFDVSDEIRDKLLSLGVEIKDTRESTTYEIK